MSRFPSPAHADRIDERIQALDDGFERLGDEDTPFTLRKGEESLEKAKQLHSEREVSERKRDEESNEPVTRMLSEWRADMMGLDFPLVDTIPIDEQRNRANQVAELAVEEGFVDQIDRNVEFRDETVRGKYWHGVQLIEIGVDFEDFLVFERELCLRTNWDMPSTERGARTVASKSNHDSSNRRPRKHRRGPFLNGSMAHSSKQTVHSWTIDREATRN
jgi:hypothetical protein